MGKDEKSKEERGEDQIEEDNSSLDRLVGGNQHIVEKGEDKRDQADAGGGDVENHGDIHPVFIFSDFVAILGQSDDNFFGLTPEFLHIIINAKVICEGKTNLVRHVRPRS